MNKESVKIFFQLLYYTFKSVGAEPRKKFYIIRIEAPLSRQPLVKGERLVRYEVSAAMFIYATIPLCPIAH